jgi:hypothetical protein
VAHETSVMRIHHVLTEQKTDNAFMVLWNRVCYRLDLLCLLITNAVNILILLLWFAPGWAMVAAVESDPCAG